MAYLPKSEGFFKSPAPKKWLKVSIIERSFLFYTPGITERQEDTQFLFERTFRGIRFTSNFTSESNTTASQTPVSEQQLSRITELTALDAELYRYATELFDARLSRSKNRTVSLRHGTV